MKKPIASHGPSIYYASDKNVFDALNQYRVDADTIRTLFLERNVLVSKHTEKEVLARYFSRLVHDYQDHERIAGRLGVSTRREKSTAVDISTPLTVGQVESAVTAIKAQLEKDGDHVQISKDGNDVTVLVQYSVVDYSKTEFKQVQNKDGVIRFLREGDYYVIRNTQNEYIDSVRETIIADVEKRESVTIKREAVSLYDVVVPALRSEFFYNLLTNIQGTAKVDVTELYVYKPRQDGASDEDDVTSGDDESPSNIERIMLRGKGVEQSQELRDIIAKSKDFYTVRVVWKVREALGEGNVFEIDAQFANPRDCTDFSYLVRAVYQCEDGVISSKRRTPRKDEVEKMSGLIESAAKKCAKDIWEKSTI